MTDDHQYIVVNDKYNWTHQSAYIYNFDSLTGKYEDPADNSLFVYS